MPTLKYFLTFLDAYNFASEGAAGIQEDKRTLINAAVSECGMWNVECGMWNVECGMWNVECGMWNDSEFRIPHSTFRRQM